MRRGLLAAAGIVAALLTAPAAAQPSAREVPPGFVLPGPPPTGTTAPLQSAPAAAPGSAQHGAADPDWPCIQRKIAALDLAAIWTGPALPAGGADGRADADVTGLVDRLAQRRLPLADAEAELAAFAASLPPETRARGMALLFAALFDRLDAERSQIIAGIERYARRQRQAAEDIRAKLGDLGARRADPAADPAALARDQQDLEWQVRIFNDRRASLPVICEVPRLVEQRLFALGRAATAAAEEQ